MNMTPAQLKLVTLIVLVVCGVIAGSFAGATGEFIGAIAGVISFAYIRHKGAFEGKT